MGPATGLLLYVVHGKWVKVEINVVGQIKGHLRLGI